MRSTSRARPSRVSSGLPDLGVTTLTEVSTAVTQITSRVDLPLIVDVDTGFGEAVNVARTVSEMERAGAAAIQIEDQVMPKRCGHLDGKQLVSEEEMVEEARRRQGGIEEGARDSGQDRRGARSRASTPRSRGRGSTPGRAPT